MANIKISWDKIEHLIFQIVHQILIQKFNLDIIIPIIRGGIIPSRLIANYFEMAEICPIVARLYEKCNDWQRKSGYMSNMGAVRVGEFHYDQYFRGNERILLIDDISDSGETFLAVGNKLLMKNIPCETVKTASLFYREKSKFIPDFYGERVNHQMWFDFPWEKKLSTSIV